MAFLEFYQSIKLVTCPLFTFFFLLKRKRLDEILWMVSRCGDFILAFKREGFAEQLIDKTTRVAVMAEAVLSDKGGSPVPCSGIWPARALFPGLATRNGQMISSGQGNLSRCDMSHTQFREGFYVRMSSRCLSFFLARQ